MSVFKTLSDSKAPFGGDCGVFQDVQTYHPGSSVAGRLDVRKPIYSSRFGLRDYGSKTRAGGVF